VTLGGYHPFDHGKILETDPTLDFVSDQITNTAKPISDYGYLSTEVPAYSDKRLRYALHSPLTLNLYDSAGRHTGISTSTGKIEEQIPGTYYTEFGDVKYLFSDTSTNANVIMNGYAAGTFTLNVDEYSGNTPTTSTTFKDIPTTANTVVSLGVQSDISTLSSMTVDENGDGKNVFTIAPKIGETVSYKPPEVSAPPPARAAGGPDYSPYTPIVDTAASTLVAPVITTTPPVTTPAVPVATTTTSTTVAPRPQVSRSGHSSVARSPVTATDSLPDLSQTASVYNASQQSVLKKLGGAVYNSLHGFWLTLKSIIGY
jgi:hypothetical protein